jgi:signal transduction histidine kinase
MFEETKSKDLPAMIKKASETIYSQGIKLTNLVESLLDFVTIDSLDKNALTITDFEISDLINETVETIKSRFKDTPVNFKIVNLSQNIKADRSLLKSAIKNLVENAIKFNQNQEKIVIITTQIKDNDVMISVGDNGSGIPPEELNNIFNKFYQVEASFTGQVEGWGLGLAFVKKVAQMHGGSVYVKSQLQKGSAFTMVLPQ